jgi:hypothetical protein
MPFHGTEWTHRGGVAAGAHLNGLEAGSFSRCKMMTILW